TQRALQDLVTQTGDVAKVTLYETDITAYNATANIPCQPKVPRFVYPSPFRIQVGKDIPEIKVRGNFLNFSQPNVTIQGQDSQLESANANEYLIKIPQKLLDNVTQSQSFVVKASPAKCVSGALGMSKIEPGSEQSVSFLVLPRMVYNISAHIH